MTVFLARLCRLLRWCLPGADGFAVLLPDEAAGGQDDIVLSAVNSLYGLPDVPDAAGFMLFAGFAAERTLWPRLRR